MGLPGDAAGLAASRGLGKAAVRSSHQTFEGRKGRQQAAVKAKWSLLVSPWPRGRPPEQWPLGHMGGAALLPQPRVDGPRGEAGPQAPPPAHLLSQLASRCWLRPDTNLPPQTHPLRPSPALFPLASSEPASECVGRPSHHSLVPPDQLGSPDSSWGQHTMMCSDRPPGDFAFPQGPPLSPATHPPLILDL